MDRGRHWSGKRVEGGWEEKEGGESRDGERGKELANRQPVGQAKIRSGSNNNREEIIMMIIIIMGEGRMSSAAERLGHPVR